MDFLYTKESYLIAQNEIPLTLKLNSAVKRMVDFTLSLCILLLVMPWLTLCIAICMKMWMPGPVFFIQKRSGKNGKVFNCYKFRSMNPHYCSDQYVDPSNVTNRFGCLLRTTSLDELPQFLNVLKGDMSIIGPRPHMLVHDEEYGAIIPEYYLRYAIKPGITGWAQINGLRGDREIERIKKRVKYDLWYIINWSFLLDLKIMYRTLGVMFNF